MYTIYLPIKAARPHEGFLNKQNDKLVLPDGSWNDPCWTAGRWSQKVFFNFKLLHEVDIVQ